MSNVIIVNFYLNLFCSQLGIFGSFLGFSGFIGFANPEKPKKPINSIYAFLHITLREPPRITRSICDDCICFCDHLSIVS